MREPDRRAVRRRETIDEILAAALAQMAENGVAALSLAEVARRIGVRPPSLYQYFPSKLAVYDELFPRGMRDLDAGVRAAAGGLADPIEAIRAGTRAFVAWAVANPVQAQIMFWRPVPGFTPSAGSYAAAVASLDLLRTALRRAVEAGRLSPAAADERAVDLITTAISGVVSQQLANEPHVATPDGRFTRLAGDLLDAVLATFAPDGSPA
jgi:AcrR family transcriptional regulator